jgi:tetratricopeptide (TPR) repeat protein
VTLEEKKRLAMSLMYEHERTRESPTLVRAVALYRQLRDEVPEQDPDRAMCLANLGVALLWLSEFDGDAALLPQAAEACREAALITPPGHPKFLIHQFNTSQLLTRLFKQTANPALLPDAAKAARSALGAVPPHDSDRASTLMELGDTLQTAYEWLGEPTDLDLAVTAFRSARDDLPEGSRPHAGCEARLCVALRLVYERTEDLDALREAIKMGQSAVKATPIAHPNYARFRGNVGNALRALYGRTGDAEALAGALEIAREMVGAFPAGDEDYAIALHVLAITLRLEYERTGELPILRQCVEAGQDAIDALQPPFLHRATYTMNQATNMRMLADRAHDRELAREAVRLAQEALDGYARNDPERFKGQNALSQALIVLGTLDSDTDALFEAVRVADDARDATPYDHPWYVVLLMTYTAALMKLYHRRSIRPFLDRAMRAASDAAASISRDDPMSAKVLANLGLVLEAAAEAGVTGVDLTRAESFARDAIGAMAPGHPGRAGMLADLGRILALKAKHSDGSASWRACISAYSTALRIPGAAPVVRVGAAYHAAKAALLAGHRHEAMAMTETAVGLVPQIVLRDVGRADREHRLRDLYGLASTAAAAAIAVDQPERAVELLEQTRGLIIASTLETRSDLTELRTRAPDLAASFGELCRAIDALDHESATLGSAVPPQELGTRLRRLAATREQLNQEWDRLLERIRQREGLRQFLQPPHIEELREQAVHGPVVYITVGDQRGHALIVRGEPGTRAVRALALPAEVTASTLHAKAFAFREAQRTAADQDRSAGERRAAQRRMLDILGWTWDNVTEPVLRHLGHTAAAPEHGPWPRIWWCPVGLVALLPLHAAGQYTDASHGDSVMDRVISSYTPSIRALAYVRERSPETLDSALVVAVPDAPECSPLDSAAVEVGIVRTFIPDAEVLPSPGAESDQGSVLEAFRRHGIAHLACHGVADWRDPSRSRLVLHDHQTRPLTVHEVTKLRLESAQLAYLSACSTTDTNALQADESTHLTAAFQLAGYRNVIGTLWPINEQAATVVARDFYTILTSNGTTRPVLDRVAEALHRATRSQRKRTPSLPTRWAAFTHYGV